VNNFVAVMRRLSGAMRRLSHGEGPPADGSPTRRNSTGERRNSTGEPRRTRSVFATRLQGARMQISVLRPSQAFNSDSEVVKWAVTLLPATAGGATLACLLEVGDDGVALRDDEGTLGTFRIDELSGWSAIQNTFYFIGESVGKVECRTAAEEDATAIAAACRRAAEAMVERMKEEGDGEDDEEEEEGEGAYASNYDGADVEEGGGSGLRMSNSEAGLRGLERAREAARRRAAARAVEDAGASSSSAPKDEAFV